MSKVWYCATCGYEIGFRGRCHRCGIRLEPSPIDELELGSDDEEVGYRLDGWADEARGRLIADLVDSRIPHRFEDDELVVEVANESQVDEIVHAVTETTFEQEAPVGPGVGGDSESFDDDENGAPPGGEDVIAEVAQLEAAARRLSADPTDMEADAEVADASTAVFLVEDPAWSEPDAWAAVGRVTRRLMAALGADHALEDEIRTQAGILVRLLQPIVHPLDLVRPASPDGGSTPETVVLSESGADSEGATTGSGDRSETVYELGEWLPEQRAELAMLLDRDNITNTWDGDDLVVPSDQESAVEAVLDRIEAVDDPNADEEATYRGLEELFAATDRLVGAPTDRTRGMDVIRAVEIADGPTPVGLDDAQWWQIRQRARILADSIEHKAQPDVVVGEAKTLRDLLRNLV